MIPAQKVAMSPVQRAAMSHLRAALFAVIAVYISGCAQQQILPGGNKVVWKQHSAQIKNLSDWTLNAKMGVKQADKGSSFNVSWQQHPSEYQIELSGPLGQGAVKIFSDHGGVTMIDHEGNTQTANSLEQLVAENTDLDLPLAQLPYWVKGIPDPRYPSVISLNENNLAGRLEQLGWQVSYQSYFQLSPPLPQKLQFQQGDKTGKLVIKRWELPG